MRFSVIVCAYNSSATIRACLKAIRDFRFRDYELIVVDDGSQDGTEKIAEAFGGVVKVLPRNAGASCARNEGARIAHGDIFVFIDSDVVIHSDALEKIDEYFRTRPEIGVLTGRLSMKTPSSNFFSQYKNLYMNYFFRNLPDKVEFLSGAICAFRRNIFEPFDEEFQLGEDTELGRRLTSRGKAVFFAKDLEGVHLKKYSFKSWVKNDFGIAYWWVFILLKYEGITGLIPTRERFAHADRSQLLSLVVQTFFLLTLLLSPWMVTAGNWILFWIGCWFVLNLGFLAFLFRTKGILFGLRAVPVAFLNDLLRVLAVVSGFFVFGIKKLFYPVRIKTKR